MRALPGLLAVVLACGGAGAQSLGPGSFSFGLIGDMPYFRFERPAVIDIVREMSEQDLAFVIHDGDFKSGFEHCSTELMLWNRKVFDSSRHPLIYVPGDNDWTDCHRPSNGAYDPEERLRRLREIFHADEHSLGQRRVRLTRQSEDPRHADYRENVRWQHGVVLFIGVNVPGSNNNYGRTLAANGEHQRRTAANIAWLAQSFELASRKLMRAVVVVMHANPLFELAENDPKRRGYVEFVDRLRVETIAFGKPVLLVHGDTHSYRIDKPLLERASRRPVDNLTRVETFGTPVLGWVKVTVDTSRPELFVVEPLPYTLQVQQGVD